MIYRSCIVIAFIQISHTEILRLPQCDKFDANFTVIYNNKILVGVLIARLYGSSYLQCTRKCIQYQECKSINYREDFAGKLKSVCELNSKEIGDKGVQLVQSSNDVGRSVYAETPKQHRKVSSYYKLFSCRHS